MNKGMNKIVSSKGIMLGKRIIRNGKPHIEVKQGSKTEVMSPEEIAAYIVGVNKADVHIEYGDNAQTDK